MFVCVCGPLALCVRERRGRESRENEIKAPANNERVWGDVDYEGGEGQKEILSGRAEQLRLVQSLATAVSGSREQSHEATIIRLPTTSRACLLRI